MWGILDDGGWMQNCVVPTLRVDCKLIQQAVALFLLHMSDEEYVSNEKIAGIPETSNLLVYIILI